MFCESFRKHQILDPVVWHDLDFNQALVVAVSLCDARGTCLHQTVVMIQPSRLKNRSVVFGSAAESIRWTVLACHADVPPYAVPIGGIGGTLRKL